MNCRLLRGYRQVFPRGGVAGWLPALLAVAKCLLPCPGKAKLVLKANKSSPGLHPVAPTRYPAAAGSDAVGLGVLDGWGGWGSSPVFTPRCARRQAALGVPTPHPLIPFGSFSKAVISGNAFWGGGLSFLSFGLFLLQMASPTGSGVGVHAVTCLFLAV